MYMTTSVSRRLNMLCIMFKMRAFFITKILPGHVWEEFEETKGLIRIRNWRRTDNTMAKRKRTKEQTTNYKTQSITHKVKYRVIRTPLITGGELRCSGRVNSFWSTSRTHRVNLHVVTKPVASHEWGKDRDMFELISYIWQLLCHEDILLWNHY
jgi:hypothetical protein